MFFVLWEVASEDTVPNSWVPIPRDRVSTTDSSLGVGCLNFLCFFSFNFLHFLPPAFESWFQIRKTCVLKNASMLIHVVGKVLEMFLLKTTFKKTWGTT